MFLKSKSAKAAMLSLGLSIGLLSSAHAATTFKYSLVVGGSSALQGDYRLGSYGPGALPQVISQLTAISGYKASNQQEKVLIIQSATTGQTASDFSNPDNIILEYDKPAFQGGGTAKENASDAMIRYVDDGSGNTNILVLVRTDSGQGIRYAANKARIIQLPAALTRYRKIVGGTPTALTGANDSDLLVSGGGNVLTYASTTGANGGLPTQIDTGVSDVSGDSVIRYVPSLGIDPSGVGTSQVEQFNLPIITLLALYNNNVHTSSNTNFKVNFTRSLFRNIISGAPDTDQTPSGTTPKPLKWSTIDPRLPDYRVTAAYRENSSGTRITELLDIQRVTFDQALVENSFFNNINPGSNPGFPSGVAANPQTGTGAMLGTVDNGYNPGSATGSTQTAIVGYAFVTGNAGSGRSNTRVGLYNGVAPFRSNVTDTFAATDGASLAVPTASNYNTFASAGLPFYSETANGRYELWTVPIALQRKSLQSARRATLNDIVSLLNNTTSTFQTVVNGAGFVQPAQMNAFRAGFISPITGEYVTDGMLINFDKSTTYNPPAPGLIVTDPNGILQ